MGRGYTEEEKAFLSQVTTSGSGLQSTSTTVGEQDRKVGNSSKKDLIFDPTGIVCCCQNWISIMMYHFICLAYVSTFIKFVQMDCRSWVLTSDV